MAIARMRQMNASVARWYHCASRCVRRAFLLEEGATDRKAWGSGDTIPNSRVCLADMATGCGKHPTFGE